MIRRGSQHQAGNSPDSENPYWVSFSDIMAGLLVIFILALVTLMIQQKLRTDELSEAIGQSKQAEERAKEAEIRAQEAELRAKEAELLAQTAKDAATTAEDRLMIETERHENLRKEIVTEVAAELGRRGVKVIVSENSSAFHIPEETLSFETGKWEIPDGNREGLRLIGDILHAAITRDDRLDYIDTIFVEGHTDSLPLQREMGNWGLSTYRAISVWNYWEAQDTPAKHLCELKNHEGEPVFSVSGYGDTRRLIPNDVNEAHRRQNRRIDVRFTMKSVQRVVLENLMYQFNQ